MIAWVVAGKRPRLSRPCPCPCPHACNRQCVNDCCHATAGIHLSSRSRLVSLPSTLSTCGMSSLARRACSSMSLGPSRRDAPRCVSHSQSAATTVSAQPAICPYLHDVRAAFVIDQCIHSSWCTTDPPAGLRGQPRQIQGCGGRGHCLHSRERSVCVDGVGHPACCVRQGKHPPPCPSITLSGISSHFADPVDQNTGELIIIFVCRSDSSLTHTASWPRRLMSF